MQKADPISDRRHVRRALTVEEVARLLNAARLRPVAEVGRQSVPLPEKDKCGRNSWTFEPITADSLDACHQRGLARLKNTPRRRAGRERLGRQRARGHATYPCKLNIQYSLHKELRFSFKVKSRQRSGSAGRSAPTAGAGVIKGFLKGHLKRLTCRCRVR